MELPGQLIVILVQVHMQDVGQSWTRPRMHAKSLEWSHIVSVQDELWPVPTRAIKRQNSSIPIPQVSDRLAAWQAVVYSRALTANCSLCMFVGMLYTQTCPIRVTMYCTEASVMKFWGPQYSLSNH